MLRTGALTIDFARQPAHDARRTSCTKRRDAIAYVTVNRPKVLNALNTPTWKDLQDRFRGRAG